VPHAYRQLLLQGTLYTSAMQLSRVSPVITFICAELAGKTFVVSLLLPIFTAGLLAGNAMATRVLRWSDSIVRLVAGSTALQAALIAVTAADFAFMPRNLLAYPLLFTSAVLGLITGFSRVTFPLALTSLVTDKQAGALLIRQPAYGAALMTLITACLAGVLSHGRAQLDDAELLWIAALIMGLAALCSLGLGAARTPTLQPASTNTFNVRDGFRWLSGQRWFRGYVLAQLIFGVVALGPMFYAIYASESLAEDSDELDVILVFIGLGLLGGAFIWTRVRNRFDFRGMYLCSAAISVAAAAVCIAALQLHLLPPVWIFGTVLLLASVANQAIFPAAQDWIFRETTSDSRAMAISLSQLTVNGQQIGLAFLFGVLAIAGPAIWPLVVVLSTSALALATALSIPRAAPLS
jgi:hypothetical protein